jgi:hypothetical protein
MYTIFNMEMQGSRKLFWNHPAKRTTLILHITVYPHHDMYMYVTMQTSYTTSVCNSNRHSYTSAEWYHTYTEHNIFALPTIVLRPSESGEHNETVIKINTHTHYSRDHSTTHKLVHAVCVYYENDHTHTH